MDDLAAFLMHRTSDPAMSDGERLRIFALIGAYQEGDEVDADLRREGRFFATHPDYRQEWQP